MTIDMLTHAPAQPRLLIVGKYAFKGFSDEADNFCSPGCASDFAYLIAEGSTYWGSQIVTFRSNVWRYELAGIIVAATKASLAEGN